LDAAAGVDQSRVMSATTSKALVDDDCAKKCGGRGGSRQPAVGGFRARRPEATAHGAPTQTPATRSTGAAIMIADAQLTLRNQPGNHHHRA